ncbi:DUF6194 family protein [Rhodococcus sp. NPDC058514]|uniref:DUF6194 family protein n=1 Tax=unclassified Rhodococcus (in: high G+C Gram-positive bacteria) TaxID=192944 RepID=UPI003651D396
MSADGDDEMLTEQDVIEAAAALPGVTVVTADEASGAPEVAWGDSFAHLDPDRKFPFATIVTQDVPGWDTYSALDRDGAFRVNFGVGRVGFEELLGYPPAAHAEHADGIDFTVGDRLLPHPAYAAQSWVSIVCPTRASLPLLRDLLGLAHAHAARRPRSG